MALLHENGYVFHQHEVSGGDVPAAIGLIGINAALLGLFMVVQLPHDTFLVGNGVINNLETERFVIF